MSKQRSDEYYSSRFLYSNGTLKNKLNIKDDKKLEKIEYLGSALRAITVIKLNPIIESTKDLQFVHKAMFGWIYE